MRTQMVNSHPELSKDIQAAYRQHVRRVSNLFGRDVVLNDKRHAIPTETSTMVQCEIPIVCSG